MTIIEWLKFKWSIFNLRLAGASDAQIFLEKGAYYLRKGAEVQVGDAIKTPIPGSDKTRKRYIKNLFFNFRSNKITAAFSDRPVKKLSEKIK